MKIYKDKDSPAPLNLGDVDYIVRLDAGRYTVLRRTTDVVTYETLVATAYGERDATLIVKALIEREGL